MATTASLPASDMTESLTPPCWMYITLSPASPCAKIDSFRPYSTIFFDSPAESRNAFALKVRMFLAINASIAAAATGLLFTKVHMLCERGSYHAVEVQMLSTLLIVLLVLWLLG